MFIGLFEMSPKLICPRSFFNFWQIYAANLSLDLEGELNCKNVKRSPCD